MRAALAALLGFNAGPVSADPVRELYPGGGLHFEREVDAANHLHGWTREYGESGVLQSERSYVHGVREGQSRLYYPTGELMTEWEYRNGLRHGPSVGFYRSGQVKDKGYYINDQLEGQVKMYYPDGALKADLLFKGGVQEGISKTYHTNGALEHLYDYRKGRLLRRETFDEMGYRVQSRDYP